jgi:hypothetical protein
MLSPIPHVSIVRKIHRSKEDELAHECAYNIVNAFPTTILDKLNQLRHDIPLDHSRPTCPRRYFTELPSVEAEQDVHGEQPTTHIQQYRINDPWVGKSIDLALQTWGLGHLKSLPKFRFLEYGEGGHMIQHQDGFSVHPTHGTTSVATMLIYLSTCHEGGQTAIYQTPKKRIKKKKKRLTKQQRKDGKTNATQVMEQPETKVVAKEVPQLVEAVPAILNSALIFPHPWLHAGLPVVAKHPKICLRVDLCLAVEQCGQVDTQGYLKVKDFIKKEEVDVVGVPHTCTQVQVHT